MQRIHENDLSGFLIGHESRMKYKHICIPAELSRDLKPAALEDNYDENGLFWSDRFSRDILDDYKQALGSYGYAGQLMQTPTPINSGMIKADWFKIDSTKYVDEKTVVDFVIDPAYTANEKNDPSALLAYTFRDNKWQIVDCINVYKEFPDLIKFIQQWVVKNGYSNRSRVYVEPKASGKSIVQTLKKETGLNVREDKPPSKDKVARVQDISASLESGRVSLVKGKWNEEFLNQLVRFPAAKHDDMVDCLVMAVNKNMWNHSKVLYFE
tara:strand:- start:34 stop:837 length:804 start_codon:yes stop_codon:yes gene_type:complete